MQYSKVEICGVNTSKLKVLSESRKRELMETIVNGSEAEKKKARDEMINGNLRLVLSVIQRFTNRGENPDDLFQVGVIGLIKAIDNFDPTLNVRFSTYGVPMTYSGRNHYSGGTYMSIISTEKAIQIGIESIRQRDDIPPKTKEQALKLLGKLEQADWYKSWTKETIIAALNDYKERTGRAPTVTSLKEHGMPKSVTIRSVFNMSPSLLLKRLFPENRTLKVVNPELSNPFGFETQDDWLNCFIEQFNKHKKEGMSSKTYNCLRDDGTPAWDTIANHCKISGWNELMKKAKVKYVKKPRETVHNIYVADATSPLVEKLNALNEERKRLNQEFFDFVNQRKLF